MWVNTAKILVAINVYFAVALRKMKWGNGRDSIEYNGILFISISRYMYRLDSIDSNFGLGGHRNC